MKYKKQKAKSILLRWSVLIIVLIIALIVFMIRSRPVVLSYAQTRAESIMVTAFDEAVENAINKLNYSYNDIAIISRTSDNLVTSIEIDYAKLNLLRSEISKSVYDIMSQKTDNKVYIPLGTLIGNEYTAGYGPSIGFNIKFIQIPRLYFDSKFYSAGINNVLHRINIKADISFSLIMHGVDETFSVKMTSVAAQTVITGAIPDNFTNVIETPGSNIADDIFNYSNK